MFVEDDRNTELQVYTTHNHSVLYPSHDISFNCLTNYLQKNISKHLLQTVDFDFVFYIKLEADVKYESCHSCKCSAVAAGLLIHVIRNLFCLHKFISVS